MLGLSLTGIRDSRIVGKVFLKIWLNFLSFIFETLTTLHSHKFLNI